MNHRIDISTELQDAIIGSLIMKPELSYDLNGLGGFVFSPDRSKVFEFILEQISNSAKVDIPLLQQMIHSEGISLNVVSVIKKTDPRNFQEYVKNVISSFKRSYETKIAYDFISNVLSGDVSECVEKHNRERELLNEMFLSGLSDKTLDLMEAREGISNHVQPTPFYALNDVIRGYMIGGYDIYAARPSMGKTTLMTDKALGLARENVPVGILSLEMSKSRIWSILACKISGVHIGVVYKSKEEVNAMNERDRYDHDVKMEKYYKAYDELSDMPIYVWDDTDCGIKDAQIVSFIKTAQKKYDVNYFFIDYLQKVKASTPRNSRNYEIEDISGELSKLPKRINCHISVFSQLSRAVETRGGSKRPQLSDLRDSGAIEQDGFNIFFLYRPEYYQILEDAEGESLVGVMELICAKNRIFGLLGTTFLRYDTNKFSYVDKDLFDDNKDMIQQETYNPLITKSVNIDDNEDLPF